MNVDVWAGHNCNLSRLYFVEWLPPVVEHCCYLFTFNLGFEFYTLDRHLANSNKYFSLVIINQIWCLQCLSVH